LHGNFAGDRETTAAIQNLYQVSTSAGGMRAKAVIAFNPATREIRSGQLPADPGFEHWLVKFDGVGRDKGLEPGGTVRRSKLGATQNYCRIEYAYHLMAIAAGIVMSPCRLLEESGRAHFMTRRFDREANVKHHLQTLCAMDHLDYRQIHTHSYAQYFDVIARLRLDSASLAEAFRRMVFNVKAANCDDHTKNFSFLLRQGEGWSLAPAYDVTHAHDIHSKWISQHLLSVEGKFSEITDHDMIALGDRFGVPDMRGILADVGAAVSSWPEFAAKAGLRADAIARIGSDFPGNG
jgi:serine/threonine-protein kinase HipA